MKGALKMRLRSILRMTYFHSAKTAFIQALTPGKIFHIYRKVFSVEIPTRIPNFGFLQSPNLVLEVT